MAAGHLFFMQLPLFCHRMKEYLKLTHGIGCHYNKDRQNMTMQKWGTKMERIYGEKKRRRGLCLILAAMFLMAFGAKTAFAASSYISNISITLDITPVPGEDLPSLHTGYTGDGTDEVMISSNEKYDVISAKWSSSADEAKLGGVYTIKVTLEALNDYKFNSSYSSSKIKVKGGTFVSAQRQSTGRLVVTVKTKPAEGTLEAPDDAVWQSSRASNSKFGYAKWEAVSDAAYDVYLYRGSKQIHKVTDLHTTSYNFYPYMTAKGTYTYRVRAVPVDDETAKYASKSEWTVSEELYVDSDEVSDGSGQKTNIQDITENQPETSQVGWIAQGSRWYFRYPDGTYLKDSWGLISGAWYLFDSAGVMQTGWQEAKGVHYYMNESGAMQTGWLSYNDAWYYLKDDGAMATGWIQLADKTYYLGDNGQMVTGWKEVDGQMYYFYPDGHKAVNEYISGFYVDLNGVWKKP